MPDPLAILAHALLPYWWVPFVLLLGSLCRTPMVKGWIGEIVLHLCLSLLLDRKRYHLFRNVTLPTMDGSTQIDHIVVSAHGIFVIETKNYGGWIFGKPHDKMWTQKFPRRSSAFQNPLRQNYKHVHTLADLLALGDEVLFSLVVFVGSAEFKTAMPENVTKLGGCIGFIRGRSASLLSEAQVSEALARIASGRLAPSLATQRAHVKHVRERVAGKRREEPVLPPVEAPAASGCRCAERRCTGTLTRPGPRTDCRSRAASGFRRVITGSNRRQTSAASVLLTWAAQQARCRARIRSGAA